jgi:hemoglobin
VEDWDAHLAMLTDFWSSLLLGTRRFKGAPIPRHAALPDLDWPLFERWLALFRRTTTDMANDDLKRAADPMAERIAAKLWSVYQSQADTPAPPSSLPAGLVRYGESPVFTPENLPEKLKTSHTTKAGTWGLLRVHTGIVQYFVDVPPHARAVVSAGKTVVIEPEVPHHVEFALAGSFQVEFWRNETRGEPQT